MALEQDLARLTMLRRETRARAKAIVQSRIAAEQSKVLDSAIRQNHRITYHDIDKALKFGVNPKPHAITKQREQDRRSIHDLAANDPILRWVLKRTTIR